jgi:hypothetical protein
MTGDNDMKRFTLKTTLLALCLGLSGQAQAGNCTVMLEDLMNWARIVPFIGNNVVNMTMTSNLNNRKFASFTNAKLDYNYPFYLNGLYLAAESLSGNGSTYFSDRKWGGVNPFNPAIQDKVNVKLTKNPLNSSKANLSITLLSWGNAKVNFSAQCENGHLFGFKADHHGTHLYDLTFTKNTDKFIFPLIK